MQICNITFYQKPFRVQFWDTSGPGTALPSTGTWTVYGKLYAIVFSFNLFQLIKHGQVSGLISKSNICSARLQSADSCWWTSIIKLWWNVHGILRRLAWLYRYFDCKIPVDTPKKLLIWNFHSIRRLSKMLVKPSCWPSWTPWLSYLFSEFNQATEHICLKYWLDIDGNNQQFWEVCFIISFVLKRNIINLNLLVSIARMVRSWNLLQVLFYPPPKIEFLKPSWLGTLALSGSHAFPKVRQRAQRYVNSWL